MATYTKIASVTVATNGTASINFNSIDQTYTDLMVFTSLNDSGYASTNSTAYLKYNSSSSNYVSKYWLAGNSGTPSTGTPTQQYIINIPANTADANQFSNGMFYINNYSTSKYKTAISDNAMNLNTGQIYYGQESCLWSDTAAISSIAITCDGSFRAGSTAYLYGIKNS